jgi:hypothetical protein
VAVRRLSDDLYSGAAAHAHVRLRCAAAAAAAEAPALVAASATLLSLDCLTRLLTGTPQARDDAAAAAAMEESQSKVRSLTTSVSSHAAIPAAFVSLRNAPPSCSWPARW